MSSSRLPVALLVVACLLPACSSDDGDTTAPPSGADVDTYLAALPTWEQFSPPLTAVGVPETETTGPTEAEINADGEQLYVCRCTPCSIVNTPDAIVTMNPNSEILYLGSLIQGSTYLGGLAAMEELPIRQRAPLTISIDILNDDNTRTVTAPTLATVTQAVGELIGSAHAAGHTAGSALSYNKRECFSLEQSMLDMGFSVSYLGASVRSDLHYEQSVEQHTIMATFRQRMFTTSVVLPQTPGEFFSDEFTQALLDQQVELERIGPDNLPVYVSNIVWGRIMVFTMTSTYTTSEMEAAISASYDGIVSGEVEAQYLDILNSEETTINMVAVGGEASHALDAIRTGNLDDYFASDAALTSAAPLSYTLRNLADNSVALVSETTEYDMVECSPEIVVLYDDFDLWRNAVLALPGGEVQSQSLAPDEMADCDELGGPPGNNWDVGRRITFHGACTGLDVDFELYGTHHNFTYNDTEFSSGFFPMLSPGDVDDGENDDVTLTVLDVVPPKQVLAVGLSWGDNGDAGGEQVRVYGESDLLLAEFPQGIPVSGGWAFVGVVAAVPITRVYYDEDAGGDDVCITTPRFGLSHQ